MQVFLVQIAGTDIRGRFGDEELICGFIKNEYVIAGSAERAQKKAIARVKSKLRAKMNLHSDDVRRAELSVNRVEPGFSWFSVFRDEGFVFHPVE